MSETQAPHICLNCDRSEMEIPLVALRYAGNRAWICSQCLPLLIHRPHQLSGKLDNVGKIAPTSLSES